MALLKASLPYRKDAAVVFSAVADQPWAILLESGGAPGLDARYDILVAEPFITLVTQGEETLISDQQGSTVSHDDPFRLLKQILQRYPAGQVSGLPFAGGAMGYFAYDLSRRIETLPSLAEDAEQLPWMAVGVYDWAVVVDHVLHQCWLVSHGFDPATLSQWDRLVDRFSRLSTPHPAVFEVTSDVSSNLDLAAYATAFRQVQRYIHDGDCYQVNLAQRFVADADGDGWSAYCHLRQISPAPFAAFLNLPGAQILSASPERFLHVLDGRVETKPIKGTRPRGENPRQDLALAADLLASQKDRAENLMIVDLLRNDIGKNCAVGSVRADRLFELESFANVHHLVSTVTGTLSPDRDAIDLLRGCFPGGSITGAPKLRAMEIIEELEPNRRGVYCGAIGYLGFDGNMDTNIAIRTAVYSNGKIRFWAGGGVVADSEMEKEYRETWDKASSMLQLMEHFHVGR